MGGGGGGGGGGGEACMVSATVHSCIYLSIYPYTSIVRYPSCAKQTPVDSKVDSPDS